MNALDNSYSHRRFRQNNFTATFYIKIWVQWDVHIAHASALTLTLRQNKCEANFSCSRNNFIAHKFSSFSIFVGKCGDGSMCVVLVHFTVSGMPLGYVIYYNMWVDGYVWVCVCALCNVHISLFDYTLTESAKTVERVLFLFRLWSGSALRRMNEYFWCFHMENRSFCRFFFF